jgi:hypothetical protein
MSRSARFLLVAILAVAIVLGISLYLRLWGGIALVVVAAIGVAWYRMQVAQAQATEQFFGDAGEDTRVTGLQGASPSEMPVESRMAGRPHENDPQP